MGQICTTFREKFKGTEWKEKKLRQITDKVFDNFKMDEQKEHLAFEDLYVSILLVYNEMNKIFPGPHYDPPSKGKVKAMVETFDFNLDGQLDREEFYYFVKKLAEEILSLVQRNLLILLFLAPTLALMTKKATEGLPLVGTTVQKIPNSFYASIVALGVVLLQNNGTD